MAQPPRHERENAKSEEGVAAETDSAIPMNRFRTLTSRLLNVTRKEVKEQKELEITKQSTVKSD